MATFEQYGAIGDGVTDDRDAVYNALNSGNAITCVKGSTYYIGSDITVTGKNINISGGAFFLFNNTAKVEFTGTKSISTNLAANAIINDTQITVVDASGFSVGDLFSITTNHDTSWGYQTDTDYRKGELHLITNITSNVIYIDDKIWHDYTYDDGYIYKVQRFVPISVIITNLIFKYITPQIPTYGLQITYAKNNVLDGVIMHDSQKIGVSFKECYNSQFKNGTINGTNHVDTGYGLLFHSCSKSTVTGNKFYRTVKCVESTCVTPDDDYGKFPNRNLTVNGINKGRGYGVTNDGRVFNTEYANYFIHTHAPSQNVTVSGNIIKNYYAHLVSAGVDMTFTENQISGYSHFIAMCVYGERNTITNNTVDGTVDSFVHIEDMGGDCDLVATGNDVKTLQSHFISIGGTAKPTNVTVQNNTAEFINDAVCLVYSSLNITTLTDSGNTWIGDGVKGIDDFIINGDFDSELAWVCQDTWSIADGVASCTGASINPTTGAMYQAATGIKDYPGSKFLITINVLTGEGTSIGVYSPIGGYIFQTVVAGQNTYEITSDGVYDGIVVINHGVVPFTINNITAVKE